ncbi:MAG: N-acetylmuramoyl-L-alanine amidase [Planctomycetota bacterium]
MNHAILLLDYGHGGLVDGKYQTNGKYYTFLNSDEPLTVYEGVVQRAIAAQLIGLLLDAGVRVFDVVLGAEWHRAPTWQELEQYDVPLRTRVDRANRHPDGLYLSLHSNAVGNVNQGKGRSARGVEMYTSKGQTGADAVADSLIGAFRKRFAEHKLPIRRGDWRDGDVDMEQNFYVLRKTLMPAVLGEVGFFTNILDASILVSEEGQRAIAEAYAAGVLPHLEASA